MTWNEAKVRSELLSLVESRTAGVSVNETSHIVADLGIDSLGVMELVADVEDKFDLEIPNDALERISTVRDVADAILDKLRDGGRLSA